MLTKIKTFVGKIAALAISKRFLAGQLALIILTGTIIVTLNHSIKTFEIKDSNTVMQIRTVQTDPYKILELAGIPAGDNDKVVSDSDEGVIEVSRAFNLTVTVGESVQSAQAVEGDTVADVLIRQDIAIDDNDYITPAITAKVAENMNISVTKVDYTYLTVARPMTNNHKVEYTYETKSVGGKAQATTEVSAKPVSVSGGKNVISTLTPQTPIALDESGRPISYAKKLTGKATAYCTGTTCSTGVKVRPGYIAVNPKQIPYGTKMYIVSSDGKYHYGYAVAADTGGFAQNGSAIADLYMTSYNDCVKFGRRSIEIYILD